MDYGEKIERLGKTDGFGSPELMQTPENPTATPENTLESPTIPESLTPPKNAPESALENWAPEYDERGIGSKALSSNEAAPSSEISSSSEVEPGLGEIFPTTPVKAEQERASISKDEVYAVNGKLSDETLIKIEKGLISELAQTGNISNFYNEFRHMGKIYQGKEAQQDGGAA